MHALVTQGNDLSREGRWHEARAVFESAIMAGLGAEAFEGLAEASRWLNDIDGAIGAWEQAYRLYSGAGHGAQAARAAVSLAELFIDYRGEPAVASGWLQRGRHHLGGSDDPTLVAIRGLEAYLALAYDKDPRTAQALVEDAMDHARRLGLSEFETIAQAQLGLVMAIQGDLRQGMRLLDDATAAAVAGEVGRREAMEIFCFLITACERVRDFDRVDQWSRRVLNLATETGSAGFAAFSRTQYANVLIWSGAWDEAESELTRVIGDTSHRPLSSAMALVLMSSLRRRQGRFDESEEFLRQAEREPNRSAVRHLVMAARAVLDLESGRPQKAADMSERLLRVMSPEDRIERVDPLEVLVRARSRLGQLDEATAAASELNDIAESLGTKPMLGAALAANGIVHRSAGRLSEAAVSFERAIELFDGGGVPQEGVRARLQLAETLLKMGRPDAAADEALLAEDQATGLGAGQDTARAKRILAQLRPGSGGPAGLTKRELEVLRLLASGKPNAKIADDLYLSVRTVERHVSNIYLKIGAFGRPARVIATAYAKDHDIT